ncbi:hypothetical protein ACJIZ3_007687 [Penstemon smallii]|uniref:Uncharacterized protein n=1 Tax=Penstemon smallii TaxID=265156 RepID=A0ABD3T8M7_9LAMI
MEVAIIDWKNIDSRFVKDEVYEHINAPKWVDFSNPLDDPVDDEAWFCRPSCNHPKTIEDFYKETQRTPISNSKLQRSASVSDVPPLGDRNKREATLKRRGINQPFVFSYKDTGYSSVIEDGENKDPNFSTPLNHKAKAMKEAIKSSTVKKEYNDNIMKKEQTQKLKSTLSARNLFSGGDLLNKVAEFCTELKKMATRAKDKETTEILDEANKEKMGKNDDEAKERKPLLELSKEKSEVIHTSGDSKGRLRRKKRNDDAENTPISVNVESIINQEKEGGLLQIRTNPPTPQGFSAKRAPLKATTPLKATMPKAFKPKPQERGILQEVKYVINKEEKRVECEEKNNNGGGEVVEKEGRTLDVFWFLKPCTL